MRRKTNRALVSLTATLGLLAVGLVAGASAQLKNASFELPDASVGDVTGTNDWDFHYYVAYTTARVAHGGSQSLRTGSAYRNEAAGVSQMLPSAPGQVWVGYVYAIVASFDMLDPYDYGVYKIEFLDASFNYAAGGVFGVDVFESNRIASWMGSPVDQWALVEVSTAPAPPGTAWARAVIMKVDVDGYYGGSIFWDDASLGLSRPVAVETTTFSGIKSLYR